jgi:hypothetical protein
MYNDCTWTMRRTGLSTRAALRYREWRENPSSMVEKSSCHLLPCIHRLTFIHLLEQPCGTGSEARIRPPWWRRVAATCCPAPTDLYYTSTRAALRYREWSENTSSMVKSSCHLLPCTRRLILIHLLEQPCSTGSEERIRPPWWRRVAATCCPAPAGLN